MKKCQILLLLFFQACTGLSYHAARDLERCRDLEARYQLFGALGVAASVLAGTGAVTTATPENTQARLALGLSSAGFAALAAAAHFVSDDVLALYAAECETSTVGAE